MIGFESYLLFLGASFLLALAPGPDNIYVMTQGISKGVKQAVIVSSGLASGVMVHTTLAALGVSVIFQTSQLAFDILKYLGALYLLYLAYLSFVHAKDPIFLLKQEEDAKKSLYIRGFLMNVLNPKVSLFFLAFLPTFTDASKGNIGFQMILLGIGFMGVTIVTFSLMGWTAHRLGERFIKSQKASIVINYITVVLFLVMALILAVSSR